MVLSLSIRMDLRVKAMKGYSLALQKWNIIIKYSLVSYPEDTVSIFPTQSTVLTYQLAIEFIS